MIAHFEDCTYVNVKPAGVSLCFDGAPNPIALTPTRPRTRTRTRTLALALTLTRRAAGRRALPSVHPSLRGRRGWVQPWSDPTYPLRYTRPTPS